MRYKAESDRFGLVILCGGESDERAEYYSAYHLFHKGLLTGSFGVFWP